MLIKPLLPHLERQFIDLPKEVKFCTKCVMSNQRPRITFDHEGVCSPCRYTEMKKNNEINYEKRKIELENFLINIEKMMDRMILLFLVVGVKIHLHISHKLKYEWGMTPLCVTFFLLCIVKLEERI